MVKRILIDAAHVEETRVVILQNGRVQEYDSESSVKQQLKGNIYLAKVTRVEPSLQAAFVDYGGNRHGFLPFSEIHPNYYDIPVADKEELLQSVREAKRKAIEREEAMERKRENRRPKKSKKSADDVDGEISDTDAPVSDTMAEGAITPASISATPDESAEAVIEVPTEAETDDIETNTPTAPEAEIEDDDEADDDTVSFAREVNLYKRYKIQEVIKRNQIILVQVEKEERGNKGASLTTFISLAGRYCVCMPNAIRRGGVSRRITNTEDRRRLKTILRTLNIPDEAGLIVRTAGAKKTEDEIRADYNYLASLWNQIRETMVNSYAPCFIHAEGDVVKRNIRDVYNDSIDEILIEGKKTFDSAKSFMKIMMPDNLSKLKPYRSKVPLFSRYKVEEQIAELYEPTAQLQSGGSIVINPTEALISIDVNSGKSTNTRNIEETALSTNLEAAAEIARQLRLRDMSGLIVIDFIDMLDFKNRRSVERALRDALQDDRAKVQTGRISSFGLLEMSRQRLRPSLLEANMKECPTCLGVGYVRGAESLSVNLLRGIENTASRLNAPAFSVCIPTEVAVYTLNHKRKQLNEIEKNYDTKILIEVDDTLKQGVFTIDKINQYDKTAVPTVAQAEPAETRKSPDKVEDNSSKKSTPPRRRGEAVNDDRPAKEPKSSTKANAKRKPSSIFSGLWKKIID